MQKRYGVLRFISGFYKVVGIIIAVFTLLSALGICATSVLGTTLLSGFSQSLQNSGLPVAWGAGGVVAGILGALGTIIGGVLAALGLYAFGELISLMISLEENTRATTALPVLKQP